MTEELLGGLNEMYYKDGDADKVKQGAERRGCEIKNGNGAQAPADS